MGRSRRGSAETYYILAAVYGGLCRGLLSGGVFRLRSDYRNVAVLIPCHNEEATVGVVVRDFLGALPGCRVVVADNNSSDGTAHVAREAGAVVVAEYRRGKGFAIRRLFADVDAECFVMVDGDATYDPTVAPAMVEAVLGGGVDMVNCERVKDPGQLAAYRRGHETGNRVLTWIFKTLFQLPLRDTLSGYRCMSRRFVKSFPTGASGFEIEAELNAHAAVLDVPVSELPGKYVQRPAGSESKLNTYRDGLRITRRNLRLFRDARPNLAFLILGIPWILMAGLLIGLAMADYLQTGQVARFPSLITGVGCLVIFVLLVIAGMIMERVTRNRIEAVRLTYLAIRAPNAVIAPEPALGSLPAGIERPDAPTYQ